MQRLRALMLLVMGLATSAHASLLGSNLTSHGASNIGDNAPEPAALGLLGVGLLGLGLLGMAVGARRRKPASR